MCFDEGTFGLYPDVIDILNFAEKRQQENIAEMRNNGKAPARKIGFVYAGKENE